jgi:hypothetical protein
VSVNLIKLGVGIDDVDHLQDVQRSRLDAQLASGIKKPYLQHITRNTPKRAQEILDGQGSLYWVIKLKVRVRQRIVEFKSVEREDEKTACAFILDTELIRVHPRSFRPFQGWRYLPKQDSPLDLPISLGELDGIPEKVADELRELGLL